MADVQTQVVAQDATDAQMFTDSRVAEFKGQLADLRSQINDLVQQIVASGAKIKNLHYSWAQLMSMFKTDAVKMYPELVAADVQSIVQSLSPSHPLYQLWMTYSQKNQAIVQEIELNQKQILDLTTEAKGLRAQEGQVLQMYAAFKQGAPGAAPSVSDLTAQLEAESEIPVAEDENMMDVSSVAALETLDPTAANLVTLQAVQMQEDAAYSEVPESLIGDGTQQVPNQDVESLGVSSGITYPFQNMKNWGLLAAAGAFIYIFLGSSSKKE